MTRPCSMATFSSHIRRLITFKLSSLRCKTLRLLCLLPVRPVPVAMSAGSDRQLHAQLHAHLAVEKLGKSEWRIHFCPTLGGEYVLNVSINGHALSAENVSVSAGATANAFTRDARSACEEAGLQPVQASKPQRSRAFMTFARALLDASRSCAVIGALRLRRS